ncbi:MAG TPA: ATP-binding protein [Bacteriovoracaceae bacterium]|nr:ATP-binding protein [Bacteriovoracaceae bacterium]
MKNLSVKVKVLSVIIALAVISLSVFAWLTFQSYKKDKLAFVYDYLSSETQSQSQLLTASVSNFDLFLGSMISGLDFSSRTLPETLQKFLEQQKNVSALYLHIPEKGDLEEVILFDSGKNVIGWKELKDAPVGLSLVDGAEGHFHLKKALSRPGAFASLVFRQVELADLIHSDPGKHNLVLNLKSMGKLPQTAVSAQDLMLVNKKVNEAPTPFGLFESDVAGEKYLVSFSKLKFQDLVLVSMIQEKKVMLIQDVFLNQVLLFLVLITSISLLIGTLGARWLTYHLDVLTNASQEMEQGNFDVHVKVESTDELGILGNAFNSMGARIKGLLEDLKRYNLELEARVQERTKELQSLSDIQKGMLNSLGQGFVIIDKDHKIQPIYSKIAEDMFEVVPSDSTPGAVIGIQEAEVDSFKELYGMTFNQLVEFEDLAKLNPEMRSNSKNQKISLKYAPISNGESGGLDYVLVIGTDKTAELETMEKFKKEWNFSQMITKIASNRFSVNKVISESLDMLRICLEIVEQDKKFALGEVQRLIHTIKGSFSYFNIAELTHMAHEFESYLTEYYNTENCPDDVKLLVLEKTMSIQVAIECYIDHYDSIVQYKDSNSHKSIPVAELNQFLQMLRSKNPVLGQEFKETFFKSKIQPYFQMYPGIVKDLSLKLNKEARFVLEGGEVEIPDGQWDQLFVQFIHVVRNSMAHGMETTEEREGQGKSRQGTITFKFETVLEQLKITLTDDGKGIDWEKMAQKDPTITCEEDAIARILTGGLSSQDEVSEVSGRGVGVSSVYATVEKWGGHLTIENSFKKGMTIVITVPLSRARDNVWLYSA